MLKYSIWFFIVYKDGSFSKEEFKSTQSKSKNEYDKFNSRVMELEENKKVINFTVIKGNELMFCPEKQCF